MASASALRRFLIAAGGAVLVSVVAAAIASRQLALAGSFRADQLGFASPETQQQIDGVEALRRALSQQGSRHAHRHVDIILPLNEHRT